MGFSLVISQPLKTSSYPLLSRCSSILKEQLQFSGLNLQRENYPQLSVLEHYLGHSSETSLKKWCLFFTPALSISAKLANTNAEKKINFYSLFLAFYFWSTVPRGKECHKLHDCTTMYVMHLTHLQKQLWTLLWTCALENSVWYSSIDGSTGHSFFFFFLGILTNSPSAFIFNFLRSLWVAFPLFFGRQWSKFSHDGS